MTRKTDKSFVSKRKAFEQAKGRLREAHSRETNHREEAHTGYGTSPERLDIEQKFGVLTQSLELGDADGVQEAIFELSPVHNGWTVVPDEVVERLLTPLRSREMYQSHLSGHVLNYFEFESARMTARQKSLCKGFLNAHGDEFTDVHSRQVVTELRHDNYLK